LKTQEHEYWRNDGERKRELSNGYGSKVSCEYSQNQPLCGGIGHISEE
jgi:hypothetical protein